MRLGFYDSTQRPETLRLEFNDLILPTLKPKSPLRRFGTKNTPTLLTHHRLAAALFGEIFPSIFFQNERPISIQNAPILGLSRAILHRKYSNAPAASPPRRQAFWVDLPIDFPLEINVQFRYIFYRFSGSPERFGSKNTSTLLPHHCLTDAPFG